MPFAGSGHLRDYILHFRPTVSTKVSIPMLDGDSFKTKTIPLVVHYGGALLNPEEHVENEVLELVSSFRARAIAFTAVVDNPEASPNSLEYPLLRLALTMHAINEITAPNWHPAEGLNLEADPDRKQIRDALATDKDADVLPAEIVAVPEDPSVPFDPDLIEGAATGLDKASLGRMYQEARQSLLAIAVSNRRNYVEYLGELRRECRNALTAAVETIRKEDAELARNWLALAMIHSATPNAQPVRVLNVAGDWLLPPDNKFTPVGADNFIKRTAQEEAFRNLVVPMDATDQSKAVSKVVFLDSFEDLDSLEVVGKWAKSQKVLVYVNAAQTSAQALGKATSKWPRGTHEDWGQYVTVVGDQFKLLRGKEAQVSLPTVAMVAAAQTVLDLRQPNKNDPTGELAVAVAGNERALMDLDGDGRAVTELVCSKSPRRLVAFEQDSVIEPYTRGLVNVPVPRDGGGFQMHAARTFFRAQKSELPDRAFESVAPVRIRNWIVRTIHRHLRNHYLQSAVGEQNLAALQGAPR